MTDYAPHEYPTESLEVVKDMVGTKRPEAFVPEESEVDTRFGYDTDMVKTHKEVTEEKL